MKLSSNEMILGGITGLVTLLSISFLICEPKVSVWKEMHENQKTLEKRIILFEQQIAQRPQWNTRLDQLRKKVIKYPPDKDVTADYLKILEQLAQDNDITLIQRKPRKEKKFGDLYELMIDCTWKGDLNALVHFLYAMGKGNVAMDLKELVVSLSAKSKQGKTSMKGSFSAICIYSRGISDRPAASNMPASAPTSETSRKPQLPF